MGQNKKECKGCRFWNSRFDEMGFEDGDLKGSEEWGQKLFGRCRRFPPVAVVRDDNEVDGFKDFAGTSEDFFEFVATACYEWCGEWKKRR